MADFTAIQNMSLTESTVQVLTKKILSGEIEAGTYLPPERNLAEMLGISRTSLRSAILELEHLGFVSIIPRHGTRVNDYRRFPTPQSLSAIMQYGSLSLDRALFNDMMDLRLWLESECARRACTNITETTLAEMLQILDQLLLPDADIGMLLYQFHYDLTVASGNSLYSMIYRGFEKMLITAMQRHYDLQPEDLSASVQMRRELLQHISSGQAEQASECVSRIIRLGIKVLEDSFAE